MSAYDQLKTALESIIPSTWKFIPFEALDDRADVVAVTMKVSKIRQLPAAPVGSLQVDWVLTLTSQYTSRETADPQLFDDLIEFVIDLDTHPDLGFLAWTEATKTVAGEALDRLAYDITVQTHANKTPDVPA